MRSHGLSRESSPYLEWDCEGTGSKLQRVPRALRFGLQLVVDQMLQTLKSCSVCRAPNGYGDGGRAWGVMQVRRFGGSGGGGGGGGGEGRGRYLG